MNRLSRRRHWRSFAALIGDPFMVLCSGREFNPEEAQDITQGFFADLLEHKSPAAVRKVIRDAFVLICLGH